MKFIRLLLAGLILFNGLPFDAKGQKVIKEGDTFSALGKYTIVMVDTCRKFVDGMNCAYMLKYEKSAILVKVCIWKENGVRKYAALSDCLSVQYAYNKNFIGIERLSNEFLKYGYFTNDSCLNRYQYFHQKILARGERSDLENVDLIAAYYPHLVLKGQNTYLAY